MSSDTMQPQPFNQPNVTGSVSSTPNFIFRKLARTCELVQLLEESPGITSGHNSFQMNDIGMIELAHDAGFAQEFPPLLLCVAHF